MQSCIVDHTVHSSFMFQFKKFSITLCFVDNEIYYDLGEGSSDARANQDNMKLSQEKTSAVPGYNIYEHNVMCSLRYFKKNPHTDNNFLI
ncbi:hypothetical protein Gotur_003863 [Gossypium turneri]